MCQHYDILYSGDDSMNKETMYDRIKRLREEKDISQDELAKRCGYSSRSTISKIEKGERNLTGDKIQILADALGVKPSYLMDGNSENIFDVLSIKGVIPLPKTNKKPRLGVIACGEPILAQENIEDYDEVPEDIRCDFTLICSGDSMINARINNGDIVYIREQPQVENGEIAACLVDGEFETKATLKRFYKYDDKIILQAENPAYPPFVYVNEEMNKVRIIGKAVGFTSKL